MGGHCELGDWVIVGGMTPIHQFVQIGAHAFVGGSRAVRKDVPPFVKARAIPAPVRPEHGGTAAARLHG
jgi:UDP-N-acetylglucosamine acyltransferase